MDMAQSHCVNPRRAEIDWTIRTDFPVGTKIKYKTNGEESSGYVVAADKEGKKFVLRAPVFREGQFDSYDTAIFGRLTIVDAEKIAENGEFDWDMASKIMNACHVGREKRSLFAAAGGKSPIALQKPRVRKVRKGPAVLKAPGKKPETTVSSEEYSEYVVLVDDLLTGIPKEKLKEIIAVPENKEALNDVRLQRGQASEPSKSRFTAIVDDLLGLLPKERKVKFTKSAGVELYKKVYLNYKENQ